MNKYTHAWLSFEAIRRLEKARISPRNRPYAENLVEWFKDNNDDVIQGAWYPDAYVKDMKKSHVLKLKPSSTATNKFKPLPKTHKCYKYRIKSEVKKKSFVIEGHCNLPDRCESIAHSVIDHLKMQCCEDKGSPVSPTNNQIGLLLFMLSHYIADAHVPFHCDARKLGRLHTCMEKRWDNMVRDFYDIDEDNERFFCDEEGYPKRTTPEGNNKYANSYLKRIDDDLSTRNFVISWGGNNNNVRDFISAICQHSYLLSYCFVPMRCGRRKKTMEYLQTSGVFSFDNISTYVLSDAIDSIARIWFRIWRRHMKWEIKKKNKEDKDKNKDASKKTQKASTKRNITKVKKIQK